MKGINIDAFHPGSPEEAGVLALARKHRLTVYDASYLELAQRETLPLATLDKDLARAARLERVSLVEAVAKP
jgi:predicted nucleic acid-binding protein